jgi:hypothetical protein
MADGEDCPDCGQCLGCAATYCEGAKWHKTCKTKDGA